MKFNFTLIKLVFFAIVMMQLSNLKSAEVIIGTSTSSTSSVVPAYGGYDYGWSAQVYSRAEIGGNVMITGLQFQMQNNYNYTFYNQKVYMAVVSDSIFANANYISPASIGATLVYSGNVTWTSAGGFQGITLQTPFNLNGNHLLVLWENWDGSYSGSSPVWYASSSTNYKSKYRYTDNSFPASTGYLTNYRTNTKFIYTPAYPNDLSVSQWVYPNSGASASSSMPISIRVTNIGSASQSNYTVKYSINNGSTWSQQTVSSTILSGANANITFIQPANMSTPGVYQCIAVVKNTGDTILSNDTIRQNITICGGGYGGAYTVGSGAGNSFPDLPTAFVALKSCGVTSSVTLKMQPGTYVGQIDIPLIAGLSASKTLTIETNTGLKDVILTYNAVSTNYAENYTVCLDSARFVKLKNLTIKALGSNGSNAIYVLTASNNIVENCLIEGENASSSTGSEFSSIYVEALNYSYGRQNTFLNNTIKYGSYAFYDNGYLNNSYGNKFIGNQFLDYRYCGLYIRYNDSALIDGNSFNTNSLTANYGISINSCKDNLIISNNKIESNQVYGLALSGSISNTSAPSKIFNNWIYGSLNNPSYNNYYGMYIYNSSYLNIEHNSVYLGNPNSYSFTNYTLYLYGGSGIICRNNSFVNEAGSYSSYIYNTVFTALDNNNYYSTGSTLAYYNGNRSNLASLKSYNTSYNQNSVSTSGVYYSSTNLHSNSSGLNNLGSGLSDIATDIDGQARSASTPDIGADEFDILNYDGGLISFSGLTTQCAGTVVPLYVSFKNFGTQVITSAKLSTYIGSSVIKQNWSGYLSPGSSTNIFVGTYTFSSDTVYNLKSLIDTVNNVADLNHFNDTVFLNGYRTALTGSFVVGASSSADFSTLSEAISALSQFGVCGPIVFNLEPGVYSGNYSFQNQINGMSSVNTLTIRSLSGDTSDVQLVYNALSTADNFIFRVQNYGYFNFKGLTLKVLNSNYSTVFEIYQASNINIDSCLMIMPYNSISNYNRGINSTYNAKISVLNSTIINGMYGIYLIGTSSSIVNGFNFSNNKILNFTAYGIYTQYADTITIRNNEIKTSSSYSSNQSGIYVNYAYNYLDINGNDISLTPSYYAYGIYMNYVNYSPYSASAQIKVYNNFINIACSSSNNSNGIYSYYCYYPKFYFNSISVTGSSTYNSGIYLYYNYYSTIVNNNLYSNLGYAFYRYYGSTSQIDYNNYFSSGLYFARLNSSYYNNFATFKGATGGDNYSKNVNPGFVSADDLHIFNSVLNDAGTPISGITKDIDGETRSLYLPDIGADEFSIVARDVFPYAVNSPKNPAAIGQNQVKVAIKNQGTSTLFSTKIFYKLDAGTVDSSYWVGNLAFLSIDSLISIGTVNLTSGSHSLKVWTKMPNGQTDLNPSNDTLVYQFNAIPKPIIEVVPSPLVDSILVCNGTSTNSVKIYNRGSANLNYNIPANTLGNDSIRILSILTGYYSTSYVNSKSIIQTSIPKAKITEATIYTANELAALIVGKDIVFIPRISSTTTTVLNAYTAFGPVLQNFVNNGGSVLFLGSQSSASAAIFNTGLFTGSYYGYMSSGYSIDINIASSPVFNNITGSTLTSNYYYSYYYLSNSDLITLASYSSYPVIVQRNIGLGKAILMGQDNYYYSTQETTLLKNAIEYLYQPKDFVVNSATTQTLIPGDSSTINITFNSVNLSNGWHSDKFMVNHNDQSQPSIEVPCSLYVDGEAVISFNKTSHSFGAVFQGSSVIDSIYFINDGCDDLIISNITTNNSYLTALKTFDTIAPGDSTAFKFKFQPMANGSFVMTATVYNNVSTQTLNFAGSGTPSPAISFNPNPVNVTITNCGDSVIVPVVITNTGGALLTGSVVGSSSDSLEVLMLTLGVYTGYIPNMLDALDYSFTKFNVTQSAASTTAQLQAALVDMDVVIIPYINSTSYYSTYASFAPFLQSFVNAGGTIIFGGQYYPTYLTNLGFFTGSYIGYEDYVNVSVNTTHPITAGLSSSTYIGDEDFLYYNFTTTGLTDLVNYGTYDVTSIRPYGNGYAIYLGFYYPSYSTQYSHMVASNSLLFAYNQKARWLNYNASNFSLSPSSTTTLNVKFKSADLITGQYNSSIQFNTNIPGASTVNLPCTLTVRNELNAGSFLGPDTSYCGSKLLNAGAGYSTYLWNTASTSQTLLANNSGYYMVTITDGGVCTSRDTVLLTINPNPTAAITGLPINACTNGAGIQMVGSPSGGGFIGTGVSGSTFYPATVSTGPVNITYTYTNSYGCSDSEVKTVNVYNPPTVLLSGLAASYCPQGNSSALIGAPSGGLFSGSGVVGNSFNPNIAGSGNHDVVYSYTDIHGCTSSDTISTIVQPYVQANITGYLAHHCINDAPISLSSTVAGTVFSGNGISGNTFNPSVAGIGTHNIYYSYSDGNNCSYLDTLTISVHALPTGVTLSGLNSDYCYSEGNVTMAGAPLGGSFIGNGVTNNVFNTQNAGAGSHTIIYEYSDVYGCSNYDSVLVTVNPLPVITFNNINPSYCLNSGTVTLSASPAGGLFSGNGVTGSSFNLQTAGVGTHAIKYAVMDNNFCMAQDSIMVTVNPLPVVSFSGLPSSICSNGSTVTLSGSPIGGTFSGNGIVGSVFNPFASGIGNKQITYSFTDNNGCSNQAQNSINVIQIQTVNIGSNQTITNNSTTQFNPIVAGGTGSFTYSWSPANMLSNPAILNPTTVALNQTTTFWLSVADNNTNCINSDTAIVTVSGGAVTLNVFASLTEICSGTSTTLNASGSGGNGNYNYSWSSIPAGFTSNQPIVVASPSVTTTYTCQVTDGTYNASQNIVITVKPSPVAQISNLNSSYCTNEPISNIIGTPAGGTFTGSGIVGSTFDPSIASIGLNNISYSYTATNGCSDMETIQVNVKKAPTAYAGKDTLLPCQNNGVQLGQQPFVGVGYSWYPNFGLNNSLIANPISTPNYPITYIFTATETNGCVATDTVNIGVIGGPNAIVSNDTLICHGETVTLNVSGGDSYVWSTGDTTASIQVTPTVTTQYFVIANQSNCADLDTILVTVSNPNPRLGKDTTVCAGNSILISPGIFSSYLWSTGSMAPFLSIDSAGIGLGSTTISVEVTNSLGCVNSDTIEISFVVCIGIEDGQPSNLIFSLYPNPSNGKITVSSNPTTTRKMQYSVVNLTGAIIMTGEMINGSGFFREELDLTGLSKGIYMLNIVGEDKSATLRITIQ